MQLCSPLAGLGATGRKVGHAQGAGGDLRVQSILHSPQRIVVFQPNERLPRRADFTFDLCQLVLRSNSPNAYVDAASAAVTDLGGHVAKKLGDGLMALYLAIRSRMKTTWSARRVPLFRFSAHLPNSTAKTLTWQSQS